MALRSGSRKRKSVPPRALDEHALAEHSPALEPNRDPPTDPGLIMRPEVRSTLLPPPCEPLEETSLESLVRAVGAER